MKSVLVFLGLIMASSALAQTTGEITFVAPKGKAITTKYRTDNHGVYNVTDPKTSVKVNAVTATDLTNYKPHIFPGPIGSRLYISTTAAGVTTRETYVKATRERWDLVPGKTRVSSGTVHLTDSNSRVTRVPTPLRSVHLTNSNSRVIKVPINGWVVTVNHTDTPTSVDPSVEANDRLARPESQAETIELER